MGPRRSAPTKVNPVVIDAAPQGPEERLYRWEWVCAGLAILAALAFYVAWLDLPIIHDAAGYVRAAKDIRANGLFSKYDLSDIRTYGWPLLLSWLMRVSDWSRLPLRATVFAFDLLFHLLACYTFRVALLRTTLPPGMARWSTACLLLNPFVIIFTTYLMTESVSFSLLILLMAVSAYVISEVNRPRLLWAFALGSVILGGSIMVRPANVCMVPVWFGAVVAALWHSRFTLPKRAFSLVMAAVLTTAPMVPQWINKVRYYGKSTPLVANDFSRAGVWLGIRIIKYSTAHIPGVDPQVMYANPLLGTEALSIEKPFAWYTSHPGKGLATLGLHVFDLLDQDQPFPYTTTLLPPYYPYAALANWLMVSLGVAGLVMAGKRIRRCKRDSALLYALAVATLICQLGIQTFFSVEARYGIPLLMILYVFAAWLARFELPALNRPVRAGILLCALSVTAASYPLSLWVRQQAPSIRNAMLHRHGMKEAERIMARMTPGGKFVSGDLMNWSLGDAGVGIDGEAILCVAGSAPYSILYHPVKLSKSTDYVVEFEARATAGITSPLSVDLYAGPAYDRAEQNSVFASFTDSYKSYRTQWNSGPDAPATASLRFVTVSNTPIQIRHVAFYNVSPNNFNVRSGQ